MSLRIKTIHLLALAFLASVSITPVSIVAQPSASKVSLPIVVTDKKGKPVENIRTDTFELFVNGKETEIVNVTPVGKNKDILLLVDLSLSNQRAIDEIRSSLLAFVQNSGNGTRMQIFGFDSKLYRPTPLTTNRLILDNHLRSLNFGASAGSAYRNALFESLGSEVKRAESFKSVILFTGGLDTRSVVTESQIDSLLKETTAVLHVIQYFEPGVRNSARPLPGQRQTTGGFGSGVKSSLKYFKKLAESTGGNYFFNRSKYQRIIGAIQSEIASTHLIQFQVDPAESEFILEVKGSKKMKFRYRRELSLSK